MSLASGLGNREERRPAAPDGQVRIASNTKMFTATVVMQLVDEGDVALDEPIEAYLPGLVEGDGIDGSRISVRQLLQHTSGLPEYVAGLLEHEDGLEQRRIARSCRERVRYHGAPGGAAERLRPGGPSRATHAGRRNA
ncbi:serine hydrolase [Arthrobacter sp. B1805]|uniref:serine hydrolase domain-containing protein n=1 Tax=Arthrobacter sp. B1805 TaxID=2058892 RepID=UPI001C67E597|nr:serine hydrolase domain-containing protein [Arthrobacter sp. B1805]